MLLFNIPVLGQTFLLLDFQGKNSDLGSGGWGWGAKKKADLLVIFRAFFFNISRTNSQTSKVNQQSVLNL